MTLFTKSRCAGNTRAMTLATANRPEVSPTIEDIWMAGPVKPFQSELKNCLALRGVGLT